MKQGLKQYICFHNHYYQPPRENAWLQIIKDQPSAQPYSNWNARINDECYAPNRCARILDHEGKILQIINNYSFTSFNIGPTLMSWIEKNDQDTYKAILEADNESIQKFGFGNAIAQVYNHMILPLANDQDKRTQIIWGMADFESRFNRKPKGIWFSEAAVDIKTLTIAQECGVEFTILAPSQAEYFFEKNQKVLITEHNFNIYKPYYIRCLNDKILKIIFYDGKLSNDIAFGKSLSNGVEMAQQIKNTLLTQKEGSILTIAVDGESYGHHHRFGEMALASCLAQLSTDTEVEIINIEAYLSLFQPESEVLLKEVSSWSCAHGVERWRSDCGCTTGDHPNWNQAYRGPLRHALDWLRNKYDELFEPLKSKYFIDFELARNQSIKIILNSSPSNKPKFEQTYFSTNLVTKEKLNAWILLEIEKMLMFMYTSCGWFFDDVSRIEAIQIMQYAKRAIELIQHVTNQNLEHHFLNLLEVVPSNDINFINAKNVYLQKVINEKIDNIDIAKHFIIMDGFKHLKIKSAITEFSHSLIIQGLYKNQQGDRVSQGEMDIYDRFLDQKVMYNFLIIHSSTSNVFGFLILKNSKWSIEKMKTSFEIFCKEYSINNDINYIENLFNDKVESGAFFCINSLLIHEKKKVFDIIFEDLYEDWLAKLVVISKESHALLDRYIKSDVQLKRGFENVFNLVQDAQILFALKDRDKINFEMLENRDVNFLQSELLNESIKYRVESVLNYFLKKFESHSDMVYLDKFVQLLKWSKNKSLGINLWKMQNRMYHLGLANQIPNGAKENLFSTLDFNDILFEEVQV